MFLCLFFTILDFLIFIYISETSYQSLSPTRSESLTGISWSLHANLGRICICIMLSHPIREKSGVLKKLAIENSPFS